MKTTIKVLSVALVVVMLVSVLASCGTTITGTYSKVTEVLGTKNGVTYEFTAGGKVKMTTTIASQNSTEEGKYKIKDGEITFTFEKDGEDKTSTYSFEKGDGYIKIGGTQYDKK